MRRTQVQPPKPVTINRNTLKRIRSYLESPKTLFFCVFVSDIFAFLLEKRVFRDEDSKKGAE